MGKGSSSPSRYNVPTTRGDDTIDGSSLDQSLQDRGLVIDGGAGNDTLKGGSGADLIRGGDGTDYIFGALSDLVGVRDGSIVWDGGKGTDTLDLSLIPYQPGNGTYVQLSLSGSRVWTNVSNPDGTIYGFDQAQAKYSGNAKGFENVVMGGGDDWVDMSNGAENNTIDGGDGNDVLNAGGGNDVVLGGNGNDMVNGSWGDDQLTGGAGSDMFLFLGRLEGQYTRDTVIDFDIDGSDGSKDALWLGENYSIEWDPDSTVLHGYMFDGGVAVGEITLLGLTYAQAGSVDIFYGINSSGGPAG